MSRVLDRFYSNGAADDNDRQSPNPFSTGMSDFGIKSGESNPFASDDGGGGFVYSNVVSPFADMVKQTTSNADVDDDDKMTSDDGNDSLDDVINNLTSEKFQQASPSMFDDSSAFHKDSERSSSSDFMAHQGQML